MKQHSMCFCLVLLCVFTSIGCGGTGGGSTAQPAIGPADVEQHTPLMSPESLARPDIFAPESEQAPSK